MIINTSYLINKHTGFGYCRDAGIWLSASHLLVKKKKISFALLLGHMAPSAGWIHNIQHWWFLWQQRTEPISSMYTQVHTHTLTKRTGRTVCKDILNQNNVICAISCAWELNDASFENKFLRSIRSQSWLYIKSLLKMSSHTV